MSKVSIFLVLFISASFVSCNKEKESSTQVEKTWVLDDYSILNADTLLAKYDNMESVEEVKTYLNSLKGKEFSEFSFRVGGSGKYYSHMEGSSNRKRAWMTVASDSIRSIMYDDKIMVERRNRNGNWMRDKEYTKMGERLRQTLMTETGTGYLECDYREL